MFSKGKYFLLQTVLALLSPITSMCVALRYYRNPVSMVFMVVFAFYFGMHLWLGNDATDHYVEMRLYYAGYSFHDIYNNPIVFMHSPEPYAFLLKYVVSRFTLSPSIFGGVISAIYMILLLNFLTALRQIFNDRLTILSGLLLILCMVVVEYTWYQGIRFWPGVIFFLGFYMRFVMTKKWYYLLIAFCCPVFHYTLLVLPLSLLVNYILMKMGWRVHILVFLLSFVVRAMHIDFIPYVFAHVPLLDYLFGELVFGTVDRESAVEIMGDIRNDANLVYSLRSEAIAIVLLLVLAMLWLKRVNFGERFKLFIALTLTLATFANVEHIDITFYDRFFKISVLMLSIAVFFVSVENKQLLNGHSLFVIIVVSLLLIFAIATNVVSMREAYSNMELWFGNFFVEWHGGMDTQQMQKYGDLFI